MPASSTQIKLGPSSLTEALFESLRTRIINGEIEPGEKVTELRVVEEYGVARPTAKSCIERLTSQGLLRRVAHRSAAVPELDEDEIKDLFFSRTTFESTAVAHLAGQRHLPAEVKRAQSSMRSAAEQRDFAEQVQADIAFHWGLVNGFQSERLQRMYEMISGEIHLTMGKFSAHRSTTPTNVVAEHDTIMAAIQDGDEVTARQALADHLSHARDRVLTQRRGEMPTAPDGGAAG
ncbi:GntR family transcriptional regulator [Nesterenkonia xinjiangensis]